MTENMCSFLLQLHNDTCIHTHHDYQYHEFNSFNFSRTWSQFLQFKKWTWHFPEIRLTNISGLLQSALTFKLQFCLFVPVNFEIICTSCNEFGCFPFPFPSICILDSVKFSSILFWNHLVRYDRAHKLKREYKAKNLQVSFMSILVKAQWNPSDPNLLQQIEQNLCPGKRRWNVTQT